MRKRRTEEVHRFNIAIPASLFKKVEVVAERDRRSITRQILCALEWMTREVKLDEPVEHV